MGVGAQNNLGGTKFLPEKFVTAIDFCQKKFPNIIYSNGIKIINIGPQMLTAKKVNSLRNKMVLPKNGQINMIAFFKAHFYFSNFGV